MLFLLRRRTPLTSNTCLYLLLFRPPTPFSTSIANTSTASTQETTAANISKLVLASTDRYTLSQALFSPSITWTPHLVDSIMKRLWNHGPKALQFFHILLHHPIYRPSSSSFDHAIDIAARLRDYKTVSTLLHRMRSIRLGPSPKSFAIVTERNLAFYPTLGFTINLSLNRKLLFAYAIMLARDICKGSAPL